MSAMFRSFSVFNYRVWFIGALVSNIGAWMQATAISWVVLTELTDNDPAAMGVTMALQFGPPLLLVGVTGWVADRFDRRKLLMVTQGMLLLLGLAIGALIFAGLMTLPIMYGFAFALGVVAAFDNPGAPGLRLGPRDTRERLERGRPERGVVQRRPHDRPGGRRHRDRRGRHRLGVRRQCLHVHRDAGGTPADPHPRAHPPLEGTGFRPSRRRVPLRGEAPGPHRHVRDGLPRRGVRHELPDLRLDDGDRVRPECGRLRPAQLHPRDRLAGGRADGGASRPGPHPRRHRRHAALRRRGRQSLPSCPRTGHMPRRSCSPASPS